MAVNVELNTLFLTEQYKFFEEQGFKIYKFKGNWQHAPDMFGYVNNLNYNEIKKFHKNDSVYSVYGIKDYIDSRKYSDRLYCQSYDENNLRNLNIEFVAHFYNKYPEYQKTILKKPHDYTHQNLKDFYQNFINILTKDKNEVMKLIHNFPISTWDIQAIDFNNLENYLAEKQVTIKEFDEFFLKFLKNRKTQLKDIYNGNILKKYLFDRFGSKEQNLTPYIELIPVLKAQFEEPEIDFFHNETIFSDVIYINAKNIKNSFLIENWNEDKYKERLFNFCSAIKDHYQLQSCFTNVISQSDTVYEIIFLHNNEDVNKKLIKKLIIDFFIYLRSNPDLKVNKENCNNWLFNKKLEEKVQQIEVHNTIIKKNKI